MQKITLCLCFDNQAEETANFYTSVFKNSKIGNITRYGKEGYEIHGREAGTVMTVDFEIEGQKFTGLNGCPVFKFNPSVSFLVACRTKDEVDALWGKLLEGGKALMELGEYPFSEKYGWMQDKFGLSWQVVPVDYDRMLKDPKGTPAQKEAMMSALLKMAKLDIKALREAYEKG